MKRIFKGMRKRTYAYRPGVARRRRGVPKAAAIICVLALLAAVSAGIVVLINAGGSSPSGNVLGGGAETAPAGRFADGIVVDGIPLGALTWEQARQQIEARQREFLKTAGVTVVDPNGGKTVLMLSDLPQSARGFDTEAVLDRALGLNKPAELKTAPAIDPSSLEQRVRDMTKAFAVAPQDARFDADNYDPAKQGADRLSFIPETPGRQADPGKLWEAVRAAFTGGMFGEVRMEVESVEPANTVAAMKASMQLVKASPITAGDAKENKMLNDANKGHTFTTRIYDHSEERLANIGLANKAVSGVVMPGEEFSMNARTGDRTAAQGYRIAKIDRSGVVDWGLGGGVCQVSGTLYNAAVRYGGKYEAGGKQTASKEAPGLAITDHDTHSLPSKYLHTGTDSTVDTASKKDIRFRNDFNKPVIIMLYCVKNSKGEYYEHCDIYGPPLPDGATYDLIRKNAKSIPADTVAPPKTVYSKYATQGKPEYIEPQKGYSVDIHIEKNVGGNKTSVLAYSSGYKPQPAIYYMYPGETAPTPTPTPTPPPTPSPTPTPSPAG